MRAVLAGTNLTGATLVSANFLGANLTGANLEDANLANASNLTQDQLDSACIDKGGDPPTLREGLKPPQKVCGPRIR